MKFSFRLVITAFLAVVPATHIASGEDSAKTISLINGKDLAGWKTIGQGTSQWTFGKAALDPTAPAKVKVNVGRGSKIGHVYGPPYGGINPSGLDSEVNSPEPFCDYLRSQTIARPFA
jgi:hypothetical protein